MPLDELTKLYDRRDLFNYLRHEVARSKRTGREFSILMVDIDHFKDVNDNYGHLRGDRVLIEAGQIIKGNLRTMDIPCRFGGDEFVVILPETSRTNAEVVAKRLLEKIGAHIFTGGEEQPDLHLTISIGIAAYVMEIENAEVLLENADKALYLAKQRGRNWIAKDIEVIQQPEIPSLNFKGFIDRVEPLIMLKSGFDVALRKKGCAVMVSGEAGVGKTRLLLELQKYVTLNNGIFLNASPFEYGVTPPYRMFFQMIKNYFKDGNGQRRECLDKVELVYKAQLVEFLPELRAVMKVVSSPPRLSPDLEKMRLFDAVCRVYEVISERVPIVIFFDDLHWARGVDLELMNYLVRNVENLSVLLCGAYRVEEISGDHALKHFLRTMSREHYFEQVSLQGLAREEVGDLLRAILGYPVKESVCERLYEETEGNPFYIEELVKSFAEKGVVRWEGAHWVFNEIKDIQVPGSVNDLLSRRFDGIEEELQDILRQGSVIGERFSLDLLREMTGKNEGYLLDVLDQGIKQLLIEENEEGDYQFTHVYLRRVLYDDLSVNKRKWLHARVGQAFEDVYRDRLSDVYESLVYHYGIAEEWSRVFEFSFKAGQRLQDMYAHQEAVDRFQACLDMIHDGKVPRSAREIEIHHRLGRIYSFLGEYDKSVDHYTAVLKRDDVDIKQRIKTTERLGGVHLDKGDLDSAFSCINDAKRFLDNEKDTLEIAQLDIDIIWIYVLRGDFDKVIPLADTCLDIFKKTQMVDQMAKVYNTLGVMYGESGDWDKAQQCFLNALKTQDKKENPAGYARLLNNLALVYARTHDHIRAISYFKEALDLEKKVGLQYMVSLLTINLAESYKRIGRFKEALSCVKKGLEIAHRTHNTSLEEHAYSTYARILNAMGESEEAMEYSLKAVDLAQEKGENSTLIRTQQALASSYLGLEKAEKALDVLEGVIGLCEKQKSKERTGRCFTMYAEGLLQLNKLDDALTYADKAIDLARDTHDTLTEIDTYIVRARIYLKKNKIAKALEEFQQAKHLAEAIGNDYAFGQCCYYSGIVLKKQGDYEDAREALQKAQVIFKRLGAQSDLERVESEL